MRNLDINKLIEICRRLFIPVIQREYGDTGLEVLRELMVFLRDLYAYIPPESIKGRLIVVKSLYDRNLTTVNADQYPLYTQTEYLAQDYAARSGGQDTIIVVLNNGDAYCRYDVSEDAVISLSNEAIVYEYKDHEEVFIVKGSKQPVINPMRSHPSVFAIPTFRTLEDALEDYKRTMVRTSRCKILSSAWYGEGTSDRLFFAARPESTLRDSLWQYLQSVLGAEVRPEQIVDESHPCDIKITWMQTNRIALIELKWLGKSMNKEGKITQEYFDSRAKEGAQQLADYLDANRTKIPTHNTRGYLVIIDARRRGLSVTTPSLNSENGLY